MKTRNYLSASVLISAALFFAYDNISDLNAGSDSYSHIIVENIVCLAITAVLFQELHRVTSLNDAVHSEKIKTAHFIEDLILENNK